MPNSREVGVGGGASGPTIDFAYVLLRRSGGGCRGSGPNLDFANFVTVAGWGVLRPEIDM